MDHLCQVGLLLIIIDV